MEKGTVGSCRRIGMYTRKLVLVNVGPIVIGCCPVFRLITDRSLLHVGVTWKSPRLYVLPTPNTVLPIQQNCLMSLICCWLNSITTGCWSPFRCLTLYTNSYFVISSTKIIWSAAFVAMAFVFVMLYFMFLNCISLHCFSCSLFLFVFIFCSTAFTLLNFKCFFVFFFQVALYTMYTRLVSDKYRFSGVLFEPCGLRIGNVPTYSTTARARETSGIDWETDTAHEHRRLNCWGSFADAARVWYSLWMTNSSFVDGCGSTGIYVFFLL